MFLTIPQKIKNYKVLEFRTLFKDELGVKYYEQIKNIVLIKSVL